MKALVFPPDDMAKSDAYRFFADYPALEGYLDSLGLFRMVPGLERMREALESLGLVRPPFLLVQVVGTNGKGSTATMLASLCAAHGLATGLHTSPHFLSVRERIRVNGALLPETEWVRLANRIMAAGKGEALSYFEFVTCLAVLAFAGHGLDLAVMETGLGGAFDATTALEADLVVFTPLGLDHMAVLGPTLRHIAADKAGAIRPGKPVISAAQRPEAREEIARKAREQAAPLRELPPWPAPGEPDAGGPDGLALRLPGAHQRENARLALAAWRQARDLLPEAARRRVRACCAAAPAGDREARALASAWLPGRMQYVPARGPEQALARAPENAGTEATASPEPQAGARARTTSGAGADVARNGGAYTARAVEEGAVFPCPLGWPPLLLDGAHNGHGMAALGLALARRGIAPAAVIFSCLADKNLEEVLSHLRALATGPIFVPPIAGNPRAADPAELAGRIGLNAAPGASLADTLRQAAAHMAARLPEAFHQEPCRNPLLICGSLYLLGEFYALRPDCLEG